MYGLLKVMMIKKKKYVENMINYINSYEEENLALQNKRIYN